MNRRCGEDSFCNIAILYLPLIMQVQKKFFLSVFPLLINSILSLFLMGEAYLSLQWRMVHDSPILYYMGFLVKNLKAVPYRDFFDMNMPGAHWLNAIVGSIFGFTDHGLQKANVLILIFTLCLIFLWLRSFGTTTAWTAANIFGILFLQYGPAMSMQREFLTLPFLLLSLIAYSVTSSRFNIVRLFLTGFFISCAVLIKPQSGLILAIFLLIDLWYVMHANQNNRIKNFFIQYSYVLIGLFVPLLGTTAYFFANHAMPAFIEVATGYWPLYTDINAHLVVVTGQEKFTSAINGIPSIGQYILWLIPAILNSYAFFRTKNFSLTNKNKILLMMGGILVSLVEVIIANKYWEYHWLPMIFFMILLACANTGSAKRKISYPGTAALILVSAFILRPSGYFVNQILGQPLPPPQGGRVDDIAEYLQRNLDPGDTVQPLDWSNGAVQAMLMVQAKPATRYLYDFHFYHHISTPQIQQLRSDLLTKLQIARPKVIIEFYDGRPRVSGSDTTRTFHELSQFISSNYYVDIDRAGYRLWMRNN